MKIIDPNYSDGRTVEKPVIKTLLEEIGELIGTLFTMILGLIAIVIGAIIVFAPFAAGPVVGILWLIFLLVLLK